MLSPHSACIMGCLYQSSVQRSHVPHSAHIMGCLYQSSVQRPHVPHSAHIMGCLYQSSVQRSHVPHSAHIMGCLYQSSVQRPHVPHSAHIMGCLFFLVSFPNRSLTWKTTVTEELALHQVPEGNGILRFPLLPLLQTPQMRPLFAEVTCPTQCTHHGLPIPVLSAEATCPTQCTHHGLPISSVLRSHVPHSARIMGCLYPQC